MFLVEQLEALLAGGRRLPLTTSAIVDQERALTLIDEIRAAVPEEIRAARRISSEGQQIIERAQAEAEQIIARAQEQAAFLITEKGLTQAAEEEGRRIVERAQAEAEEIRRGADEYAAAILAGLERDLSRTLQSVQKGLALLAERQAALRNGELPPDGDEEADDEREEAPQAVRSRP
jgi:hypothetical protein